MHTQPLSTRFWLSLILASLLLTSGLVPPSSAKKKERKPIVISFGQPNIWSLEQAHYLLARMHAQNVGLKAKDIADTELDPNAVNATRINILKTLLEVNAQYDQGVGFQNKQLAQNQRFNQDRRFELTTKRDGLRDSSLQATRDIHRLQFERAQMVKAKASEEELALKDAEIEQKKADQAALDKEIGFYNDELKTLTAEPSGTPQAPTASGSPFDKSRFPTSILDEVVKDDVKKLLDAARDPRLDASTMLDNHIQLQYEIIAKQLTLLRDEVGPGERLVFLELPQSIYSTPGAGDEKMAQSWWHVNGYTKTDPLVRLLLELYEVEVRWQKIQQIPAFLRIALDLKLRIPKCLAASAAAKKVVAPTEAEKQEASYKELSKMFAAFQQEHETARKKALNNLFKEGDSTFARVEQRGARDTSELIEAIRKKISIKSEDLPASTMLEDKDDRRAQKTRRVIDLNESAVAGQVKVTPRLRDETQGVNVDKLKNTLLTLLSDNPPEICEPFEYTFANGIEFMRSDDLAAIDVGNARAIERRTVRTVDIIPRQSSLIVNDIQETVKATGILAAFKFLFGFAGQINYQRQREQYEQYLHQELFASGFGKGNSDFGWTFGALPGTKRVAPGVRTTYAALVVPVDAESIVLSARGCYFPRKGYQPLDYQDGGHTDWGTDSKLSRSNCSDEQTYILPIPGGGGSNNFWVTNLDYQPVKEGQRAVVSIRGNNFSSQIGVLVDGVALKHSIGLAQPLLASDSESDSTCKIDSKVVCGKIERIDARQIIISFIRPGAGTPLITLMAPGKAVDLNWIPLTINGEKNQRLKDPSNYIFLTPAEPEAEAEKLAITDLSVFRVANSSKAVAVITGTKFTENTKVFVNGKNLQSQPPEFEEPRQTRRGQRQRRRARQKLAEFKEYQSPKLYRLVFNLPSDKDVTVTLTDDDTVVSKSVDKPGTEP